MYWALLKQGVARWRRRLWRAAVMRSGLLTFLALTLVLAVLAFGWREHRLGQFAQLKQEIGKRPVHDVAVRPGGQDVVELQRSQLLAVFSVGSEIIQLRHIASRLELETALDSALEALAQSESAIAVQRLALVDQVLASHPGGAALRARGLILAISASLTQHAACFDAGAPG